MRNGVRYINYDKLNNAIRNFDANYTKLNEISGFKDIYLIYDDIKLIENLKKLFIKKTELVDTYIYLNASTLSFLLDCESLAKQDKDLKEYESLFLRMRSINFDSITPITALEDDVYIMMNKAYVLKDEIRAKHVSLLGRANFIVSALKILKEVSDKNINLNIATYLKQLSDNYAKNYDDIILTLQTYIIGAILSFLVLFGIIIFMFYKQKMLDKLNFMQKLAIDSNYDSILLTDKNNKIVYVNKTFEETNGYTLNEIIGKNPNILKSHLHKDSYYEELKQSIKKCLPWNSDEIVSRAKDGKFIHEKLKILPFSYDGEHEGFIGLKMDKTHETEIIRELESKNEQLKAQSSIDKLTGFGNYFSMNEILENDQDGIVISLGIKNYNNLRFFYQTKIINAMILAFANTLKLCVETSEINARLFRFQDDDFYLWYNGDNAIRDIGYIQDYFGFNEIEVEVDGERETLPGIRLVVGISLNTDTAQTNRLMQAMLANQQARQLNNDIYEYKENDEIELRYQKNQVVTQLIEYALENDTVIVECQGLFDIKKLQNGETPKANYYEVLVRIIDQNGKIHYPGEFLEIAQQTQLYTQITKKIIEHGFKLVERYPEYTFSINLSGIDMVDSSVREFLEEKLTACTDPTRVCFEILESEEIGDYDVINSFIKHIKEYGSKISIDDFGSGYSNYYRILELDIDTIKIDGSIIKKLPFDKNAQYLVETIVNFASKQNYKTVAEFVSNEEILEKVKEFNITYAQGFLLGKPSPVDKL
ncbi:MAG: EAL domain-containing protein [Campylobacter sp.]|nr:EAL domain-containing protein [Campylobacter sp.]